MERKTVEFLETLEGLLTTLEERAKTDMMSMGEFRAYITEMLEQHYRSRYDDEI